MLRIAAAEDSSDNLTCSNPAYPERSYMLSMTVPALCTIAALPCMLDNFSKACVCLMGAVHCSC